MSYRLEDINYRTVADPKAFIEECDAVFQQKVETAADRIADNIRKSPIVLLAGPSGSGKTTTSMKLAEALGIRGIHTHYVAMDNYYLNVDPNTTPRTKDGDYDLESPLCIDMELMNRQFKLLTSGEEIEIPRYEFATRKREAEPSKVLRLKQDEVVILEGIHALNDMVTHQHPEAYKMYISARSDVTFNDIVVFTGTWFRLVRRMVRDANFRGASAERTMSMWANVRRGEKMYISPFKNKADVQFDTVLPYEIAVMNHTATSLFASVPEGIERYDELRRVYPALQLFGDIDEKYVAGDSLIREFIGGGIYRY